MNKTFPSIFQIIYLVLVLCDKCQLFSLSTIPVMLTLSEDWEIDTAMVHKIDLHKMD